MSSTQNTRRTAVSAEETVLSQAIVQFQDDIQRDIRFYLRKFGNESEKRNFDERVEDVWQETVVEALRSALNFDPKQSARGWLRAIAFRRIHKSWEVDKRKNNRFVSPEQSAVVQRKLAAGDDLSETEMFDLLTAKDEIEKYLQEPLLSDRILQRFSNIEKILSLLPNQADRTILHLRYAENLRGRKLAEAVGETEGTAQKRSARALNKLYQALLLQDEAFSDTK